MSTKTKTFIRHYVEMVIAMYVGMALLLPLDPIVGDWSDTAPGASLAAMGLAMTWPMVAWMRYRGHGWRPCWEMAASMIVPTTAALILLASGAVTGHGTLMTLEHVAMFPAMLLAMLARPGEYTSHAHHEPTTVTANA
jgi:hypothetical protein